MSPASIRVAVFLTTLVGDGHLLAASTGKSEGVAPPEPVPAMGAAPAAVSPEETKAMALEADARLARSKKLSGYQIQYLKAAWQYVVAQRADRARAVLDEVIADPGTPGVHIEALRMKAMFLSAQDEAASHAALEECLRVWKANRDRHREIQWALADFIPMLEQSYVQRGEVERAIEVNTLVTCDECLDDPELRHTALLRRASLLERAGRLPEASAVLEALFKEVPDLELASGNAVYLRWNLAEWKYPDRASPQRLEAIRAIWTDPKFQQHPAMIDLGYELHNLQRLQGHIQDGFVTLRQTIDKIDVRLAAPKDPEEPAWVRQKLVTKLRTYLAVLGNTYDHAGQYEDALRAWRRYEALIDSDVDRASTQVIIRGLQRRMKAKADTEAAAAPKEPQGHR